MTSAQLFLHRLELRRSNRPTQSPAITTEPDREATAHMATTKILFIAVGAIVNASLFAAVEWEAQTGQALAWLIGLGAGGAGWLIRSTAFGAGKSEDPTKSLSRQISTACLLGMICGCPTSWLVAYCTGWPWGPMMLAPIATAWGAGGLHFFMLYGPSLLAIIGSGTQRRLKSELGVDDGPDAPDDSTKRKINEIYNRLPQQNSNIGEHE